MIISYLFNAWTLNVFLLILPIVVLIFHNIERRKLVDEDTYKEIMRKRKDKRIFREPAKFEQKKEEEIDQTLLKPKVD